MNKLTTGIRFSTRGNSGATWKLIKEISPNKRGRNHSSFENESYIAEKFNEFFASVGERTFQTTQNNLKGASQSYNNPQHYVNPRTLFSDPVLLI